MYNSPIKITIAEMQTQFIKQQENDIYQEVLNCGIAVDKEELVKALQHDREQYQKGYEDGVREFANKLIEHYFYDLERLGIFKEDVNYFADKVINDDNV